MTELSQFLQQHPLGAGALDAQRVEQLFVAAGAWEERYRALIQLGKQLPALTADWRGSDRALPGCESQVWLVGDVDARGHWHFAADSEARIVRGLLAVVLAAFNHQTAAAILAFDVEAYFDRLQLAKHLSPSRGNGLQAMVNAIRSQVSQA